MYIFIKFYGFGMKYIFYKAWGRDKRGRPVTLLQNEIFMKNFILHFKQ